MSFLSFYLILKDLNNIALFVFLLGRILDGVDGIIANKTRITEFGGFIDIVFDLISYSLVPLAFILKDNSNAIFGSILLTTFFGTSSTFFGIAIFENNKFIKRNPEKSFFHVGGFMGGSITIFFLSLMFASLVIRIREFSSNKSLVTTVKKSESKSILMTQAFLYRLLILTMSLIGSFLCRKFIFFISSELKNLMSLFFSEVFLM